MNPYPLAALNHFTTPFSFTTSSPDHCSSYLFRSQKQKATKESLVACRANFSGEAEQPFQTTTRLSQNGACRVKNNRVRILHIRAISIVSKSAGGGGEAAIIETLRRRTRYSRSHSLVLGIGDDCAIFRPPGAREDLLFTTDLL